MERSLVWHELIRNGAFVTDLCVDVDYGSKAARSFPELQFLYPVITRRSSSWLLISTPYTGRAEFMTSDAPPRERMKLLKILDDDYYFFIPKHPGLTNNNIINIIIKNVCLRLKIVQNRKN